MTEGEVGSRGAEAVLGGTDGTGERRATPGARAKECWRLAGGEARGKKGTLCGGVEAKKTGPGMSALNQTRGTLKKDAGRRDVHYFPSIPRQEQGCSRRGGGWMAGRTAILLSNLCPNPLPSS